MKIKIANRGRNWHAINAQFRKAGSMTDKKKESNKNKCRRKTND